MKTGSFVLKGDLCYSLDRDHLKAVENGYLVCVDGVSAGTFDRLPEEYRALPLKDYTGKLIVPGLVDLHVHAPQYTFRGLGLDMELLEWLERNTFPEEAKYRDIEYARAAYRIFAEDLRNGPNTRACIFATVHVPGTLVLMDILEESGLITMVGKVNMDRNASDALLEADAAASLRATEEWLDAVKGKYLRTTPILTPRFVPSCTDALLDGLGEIQRRRGLPVQSHLSENRGEVKWVKELCPWSSCYADAYDRFGLFGGPGCPTIMAHCVLSGEEEVALMKERGVYVAHCPQSNTNLASGVAPVRRYLEQGLRLGLGSDVAGGNQMSIFRAMADAIQASKLRWRLQDESLAPLTVPEVFWMGTMGGGSFFGKVGSFEAGYELDAVVLND
ncbi:MAG TPA: amidohydrolase family protein, partial [Candidatus Galloscillospira stercoripullorum]|nr:amidohydrolase family protein [Candidatus Galloscillospira stercoripullorum]